ncbi:MAG: prepilin-type N-terminal cleavage/methylation domain-containing protein [Deltaproteobacteria bacterium]|nr:prepilin-type N-terminal cleavage/methylation domain-containing protein [Deltaproteobacteria bacterium]
MRGYTLIEILVTMSVMAVMAAIALPHFDSRRLEINNAQRLLIANLRQARFNAISKSIHFQVSFPQNDHVVVSRMKENPAGSGTWEVDTTEPTNVQTTSLPAGTTVKSAAVGTTIEFNSRGIVLNMNTAKQVDVQDTFGVTRSLQVWPSGQVNEL